jgi:predicted amidohydrolase
MFQCGGLDAQSNLDQMDGFLGECARGNNCDIVVFPELFLCGYDNAPFAAALHEGWEQTSSVKEIVTRHGIAVVVGLAELEKGKLYNTVAFFQGNGKVLMKHRKTHLWGDFERKYFTPGNTFPNVKNFLTTQSLMKLFLSCVKFEFSICIVWLCH